MSGLFKNFDKLIPAATFTSNTHKFLVRFCGANFSPAGFYYDPSTRLTGLPRSHGLDLFGLSSTSYELTRLNKSYEQVLADVNGTAQVNQSVKAEVEEEINLTNKAAKNYLNEALLQLRSGGFTLPVKSCADLVYTLAFNSQDKKHATEVIRAFIVPTLRAKLQYASTQNLIDVVVGLNELQFFEDQELWRDIFSAIERKTFTWEFNSVEYHGWALDVYETGEGKSSAECGASDLELYWNDLKGGSTQLANWKRQFRFYWNFAINRIVLPFFYRENRVLFNFPSRNRIAEKELFFATLKNLEEKFPAAKNAIGSMKGKEFSY